MRISDWSSDVCSSDLAGGPPAWAPAHGYRRDEYRDYGLARPPIDLGIGRCNREVIGKLLGGAAGAAAGSQIGDGRGRLAAIAAGTIVGLIVGGEVGRRMDRADAPCMAQAMEYILEEGRGGKGWGRHCRSRWAAVL